MRKIEYDTKDSASTENHLSVDAQMEEVIDHTGGIQDNAFREGFAASSGIRPESAETGGQLDHPETLDDPITELLPDLIEEEDPAIAEEEENAGLADN